MADRRPGKSTRGAGNAGHQPVSFTLQDAQRINNVVGSVERSRRSSTGESVSRLPRSAGGGGGTIFLGTFSGSWLKGDSKTITLTVSTTTVNAVNHFASISMRSHGRIRNCAVAIAGGQYILLAAECD